jgi:UDP-glucose 4-epimerase
LKIKIILTGSTGFVGRNLVKFFKTKGINLVKLKTKDILKSKINYKKISHILHAGFDMRKNGANVNSQLKILEKLSKYSIENNCKIIFLSSSCFGKSDNRKLYINNDYQIAKKKCEDYLIKNKKLGLKSLILRVFNLYGPGQKNGFIVSDAIFRITKNKSKKLELYNYKNTRDFIFISDLVKAIYNCIILNIDNKIIEIGYGKSYSIKYIYDKVKSLLNRNIYYSYKKPYVSKLTSTKALIKKNKKIFKWEPKINIENGLKIILKIR